MLISGYRRKRREKEEEFSLNENKDTRNPLFLTRI